MPSVRTEFVRGDSRLSDYWNVGLRLFVGLFLVFTLPGSSEASWDEKIATVHFHPGNPDFGTPPRQTGWDWTDGDIIDRDPVHHYDEGAIVWSSAERNTESNDPDMSEGESEKTIRASLLITADTAIRQQHWQIAERTYEQIAYLTGWTGDLRDRTMVLHRVENMHLRAPAFLEALQRYLKGMQAIDGRVLAEAQANFLAVVQNPKAGFLQEHALYQLASCAFENQQYPHAITLYQRLLHDFPRTECLESALMMIARCCILPKLTENRRLELGQQSLDTLLKAFPKTRFYNSVLGLKGRIHFLKHRYRQALWCYFTVDNLDSVQIVRNALPNAQQGEINVRLFETYLHHLTSGSLNYQLGYMGRLSKSFSSRDLSHFIQDLQNRPDLMASYVYYRLYHTATTANDLIRLANLVSAAVQTHPHAKLSPSIPLRLAEIYYQQRAYTKAIKWSDRALALLPNYDRALYVRAASRHKQQRYRSAIDDMQALLKHSTASYLRHGAREELALCYEAVGDLSKALDQYFALNYKPDIAYLLDIRMSPSQIEAYFHHDHDNHLLYDEEGDIHAKGSKAGYTHRQLLAYTLGIRSLQDERWKQAAYWLKRVPAALRKQFDHGRREWGSSASPDALTAVEDLCHLQRAIGRAHSDEARAAAMYQYASYYHNHGCLLLYNPMLWDDARVFSFQMFWNKSAQTKADTEALREYLARHEVYLRSRALCLQIVREYPRSKVAPQALYRAACASYRAGALTEWLQKNDKIALVPEHEAEQLMREVARRYPHSPLAEEATKYAGVFAGNRDPISWKRAVAGTIQRPLAAEASLDTAELSGVLNKPEFQ